MRNLLLVFIITFSSSNVFTCWYDEGDYGYTFFEKQNVSDPTVLYFIDYEAKFGIGYSNLGEKPGNTNLNSWKAYLGTDAKDIDILNLVYKTESTVLASFLSNKKELKAAAEDQSVLKIWLKNKRLRKSMGKYLLYAKSCAAEAQKEVDYWDEKSRRDQKKMQELLNEGTLAYKKEKDNFIKERYAFQLIRLAFYMEDFNGALALFNEYFPKEAEDPSYIYYRALELKAGVLHREGEPEASYLYAKVFANCPDRREICLNSFSLTNAKDWERSINLCKTNQEKAIFYTMRGLQSGANMAEEVANIVEVAPNSPFAEMLFCRYISDVQHQLFPYYYEEYKPYPHEIENNKEELKQLQFLCRKMLENPNLNNQDFWKLATAYLELMHRNYGDAMRWCTEISESSNYYEQSRIIRFVAQLCAIKRLDNETVDVIWAAYQEDKALSNNFNVQSFLEDALAMLYYKQGDYAKAFLSQNRLIDLSGRMDLPLIKDIERFVKTASKDPGDYERFLLEEKCGAEEALDEILQMKGVYYLQHNQLDKAITTFEKLSGEYQRNNSYFNNSYLDRTIWVESIGQPLFYKNVIGQKDVKKLYKDYDFLDQKYNLLTFAKQLKELEQLTTKEDEMVAEYYYLLGIAWYNISPAGWSRPAIYLTMENGGHSNWFATGTKEKRPKTFHNYEWNAYRYFNPEIGTAYFEKAMMLAEDPELEARACYMAAKMQKAKYHTDYWWNEEKVDMTKYNKFLDRLKADFGNTAYYQEVIKECPIVRARD